MIRRKLRKTTGYTADIASVLNNAGPNLGAERLDLNSVLGSDEDTVPGVPTEKTKSQPSLSTDENMAAYQQSARTLDGKGTPQNGFTAAEMPKDLSVKQRFFTGVSKMTKSIGDMLGEPGGVKFLAELGMAFGANNPNSVEYKIGELLGANAQKSVDANFLGRLMSGEDINEIDGWDVYGADPYKSAIAASQLNNSRRKPAAVVEDPPFSNAESLAVYNSLKAGMIPKATQLYRNAVLGQDGGEAKLRQLEMRLEGLQTTDAKYDYIMSALQGIDAETAAQLISDVDTMAQQVFKTGTSQNVPTVLSSYYRPETKSLNDEDVASKKDVNLDQATSIQLPQLDKDDDVFNLDLPDMPNAAEVNQRFESEKVFGDTNISVPLPKGQRQITEVDPDDVRSVILGLLGSIPKSGSAELDGWAISVPNTDKGKSLYRIRFYKDSNGLIKARAVEDTTDYTIKASE